MLACTPYWGGMGIRLCSRGWIISPALRYSLVSDIDCLVRGKKWTLSPGSVIAQPLFNRCGAQCKVHSQFQNIQASSAYRSGPKTKRGDGVSLTFFWASSASASIRICMFQVHREKVVGHVRMLWDLCMISVMVVL